MSTAPTSCPSVQERGHPDGEPILADGASPVVAWIRDLSLERMAGGASDIARHPARTQALCHTNQKGAFSCLRAPSLKIQSGTPWAWTREFRTPSKSLSRRMEAA